MINQVQSSMYVLSVLLSISCSKIKKPENEKINSSADKTITEVF